MTHEMRNQWVLVEQLNRDESGLLAIGSETFAGASVRKNLDALGRDLLLEPLRAAAQVPRPTDCEVTHRNGTRYRIIVDPILSPLTGTLVACLALYAEAGDVVARRPKVGATEWRIAADGGIETAWNDDLHEIYELPRTGPSPVAGMNEWISRFVAPEDRARMKVTIDASISSANTRRYLVPYRIVTARGMAVPTVKNLQACGRVIPGVEPGTKWLRAITREVSEVPACPVTPEFGDYESSSLLRAAFDLVIDRVLMAVDTACWQTFMVSDNWGRFGLERARDGYLEPVVHPGDYQLFQAIVALPVPARRAVVRFLHADGRYRPYTVTASTGRCGAAPAEAPNGAPERYVVVKLTPE
ncbi:hypothetical protein [Paenarthrobacter sp. DKR-5]|uniref:hypothetical protein n=1 Tax=Paenarthrobacter sp. DKR-5 TaxID=2835535 RepID=UPI0027DCF77A|nr:hypothetical protein [Paenarthrobacter sp. DKR-5]